MLILIINENNRYHCITSNANWALFNITTIINPLKPFTQLWYMKKHQPVMLKSHWLETIWSNVLGKEIVYVSNWRNIKFPLFELFASLFSVHRCKWKRACSKLKSIKSNWLSAAISLNLKHLNKANCRWIKCGNIAIGNKVPNFEFSSVAKCILWIHLHFTVFESTSG